MSNMNIYGCGGFGVNIVNQLCNTKEELVANKNYYCIDTSFANLKNSGISKEDIFVLEGKDGSGGVRGENLKEALASMPVIVERFKPNDFNIVLFSLSGGSGSILGPLLVSEIVKQKKPVVIITIGTEAAALSCKNTYKTLQTLENTAKENNQPVVMTYLQQDSKTFKRSEIDAKVIMTIAYLSILNSGNNEELDSKDIEHWVFFNKTTNERPQLALLNIYPNNKMLEEAEHTVSLLSLYSDRDNTMPNVLPDYSKSGFFSKKFIEQINDYFGENSINNFSSIHYSIQTTGVKQIFDYYKSIDDNVISDHKQKLKETPIITDSDQVSLGGIIL